MIKRGFLSFVVITLSILTIQAQDNVGIGTTTPDASALLDMVSSDKGLLIPRVELLSVSNNTSPVNNPATGLLVYNESGSLDAGFYYWDGTEWVLIGSGGGATGCVTLDEAYNCETPGAGRSIAADYGAVEITLNSGSNAEALTTISNTGTSGTPTTATGAYNTAYGGSIYAENTNTANPYNTIEGATNSNNQYTSGVAGYYVGTGEGVGVYGSVYDAGSSGITGVLGVNNRTNGGWGVEGQGFNGVVGQTNYGTGFGTYGSNTNTIGANDGVGVMGDGFYGVWGQAGNLVSNGTAGVFGINSRIDGGWGVEGQGFNGTIGLTSEGQGYGVYGENSSIGTTYNNIGTAGLGWVGVFGETNDFSTGYGVYANGDLGSSGTKSFVIDHPLDPENKYLKHYSIESPEVLNLYRGVIQLDANGEATIELPDYFEAINTNYSYQLTPIGASAPGLFIKEEINNGKFTVAGGQANMKVSWTVYSERNDAYMQKYPEKHDVVIEKRDGNKGKYLIPELYNQPDDKKITKPLSTEIKSALKTPEFNNATQEHLLIDQH